MSNERVQIRLNFSTRELEIDGPPAVVRELLDKYQRLIEGQGGPDSQTIEDECHRDELSDSQVSIPTKDDSIPDSFGEFLHPFPDSLSGPDKAIIAALYVQSKSEDNSFSTREVNALLKEQGIRLANASSAIKRAAAAKNAFPIARGRFRVSTEGRRAVQNLKRGKSDG